MSIGGSIGKRVAPHIPKAAPEMTHNFVREALNRAIRGVGALPPAAFTADKLLKLADGNSKKAIRDLIEMHVRYAGGQGFLTNLGGLVTAAVTIPANVAGLALIQCRMVAAIAHLRGYDLDDPRVRNAILALMLGEDDVMTLVKKEKLPATPMAIATAPVHDPDLDKIVASDVASELITKAAGKHLATAVGRRIPVLGGMVGLTADGYSTWRIGRYADREFLSRPSARR
ncbi:MAG: EcsC family protein [Nocardioides sp.]|nr:EcsC family protein [Nocardioides sp.]